MPSTPASLAAWATWEKSPSARCARSGASCILIYCSDYTCGHSQAASGNQWAGDLRLSDIEPRFTCRRCGRKGADVRPDYRPTQTIEPRNRRRHLPFMSGKGPIRGWPSKAAEERNAPYARRLWSGAGAFPLCLFRRFARERSLSRQTNRSWTELDDATIREVVADGKSATAICAKLGRTVASLRARAAVLGLKVESVAARRKRLGLGLLRSP
jgi:hypothetical protein